MHNSQKPFDRDSIGANSLNICVSLIAKVQALKEFNQLSSKLSDLKKNPRVSMVVKAKSEQAKAKSRTFFERILLTN
jgi:hypothetical protein